MYSDCTRIIQSLVGPEYLYFDEAITIKLSPHSYPISIWGVCVCPKGSIYLMDAAEAWHKLEEGKKGSQAVVQSLYQRLKLIEKMVKPA